MSKTVKTRSKSKSPSPRASRKTQKKKVAISDAEPDVRVFSRDFSPDKKHLLWTTKEELRATTNERNWGNDNPDKEKTREYYNKNRNYRKKILSEMESRDTARRMAAYYGKLKETARNDEEPIVLARKSREHQIKGLQSPREASPQPEKKRNFLFRVFETIIPKKSSSQKRKGGKNKTMRSH